MADLQEHILSPKSRQEMKHSWYCFNNSMSCCQQIYTQKQDTKPSVMVQVTNQQRSYLLKRNNGNIHSRNQQFLRAARIELTRPNLNTNDNHQPTIPAFYTLKWKHWKTPHLHCQQNGLIIPHTYTAICSFNRKIKTLQNKNTIFLSGMP